jgi:hypothetical protein
MRNAHFGEFQVGVTGTPTSIFDGVRYRVRGTQPTNLIAIAVVAGFYSFGSSAETLYPVAQSNSLQKTIRLKKKPKNYLARCFRERTD